MSTVFSGGTYVNTTLDGSTKANLIADIQAKLTTAGWTVSSGGGTTNLLMQTAQDGTTLNQGRVRFKDNGGNCVQVTLENVSGSCVQTSGTTHGGNLLCAAGKVYHVLASKYRFEIFTIGNNAREVTYAGILWIPAPYQGVITEAIYLGANAINDTDSTLRNSFRNSFGHGSTSNQGNCAGILNASLMEVSNTGSTQCGMLQMRVPVNGQMAGSGYNSGSITNPGQNLYRWHDLALDQADCLVGWATASMTDEALLRGQMYDWTQLSDAFSLDSTDSWSDGGSSHNFYCFSSIAGSASQGRGSLWVAYS